MSKHQRPAVPRRRHARLSGGLLETVRNETRQQVAVLTSYVRAGADPVIEPDPQDTCITRVLRSGQSWEAWLTPYFTQYCTADTITLDVGANIGTHTVDLARWSAQVHAFEPQERVHAILARNTSALGNVITHHAGASDTAGVTRMKEPTGNVGATQIAVDGTGEQVTLLRLDDLHFDAPVGFIKMDVEKHEREALLGARALITHDRPVIILEDQSDARAVLAALGYRCRRISAHDFLCLPPGR
jgi:FkbM family methyltransferase